MASLEASIKHLETAEAILARIRDWTHQYGAELCPPVGTPDAYGEGVRACKEAVRRLVGAVERDAATLSAEAREQRTPRSPEELVGALSDRIHREDGPARGVDRPSNAGGATALPVRTGTAPRR